MERTLTNAISGNRLGLLLGAVLCTVFTASSCQSPSLAAARLYLAREEYPRAREQLLLALSEVPDDPEARYLLGRVCAHVGDYACMDSCFRQSAVLSPRFAPAMDSLRHHYWALEQNTGARLASGSTPDYPAALRAFHRAVVIDPGHLESWRNAAQVYRQLDSLQAAAAIYTQVLTAAPEDTASLAALGFLHLEQGADTAAVQILEKLIRLAPTDARARVRLAGAYEELGRPAEAEAALRAARLADPRYPLAAYNLGNLLWRQGRHEAAREAYEQAATLAPDDGDTRYNLAVACLATGR
ncbi:MAG: tetratricopeptide repeat protein, partial [Candidatus Latescibacterota bacterium]